MESMEESFPRGGLQKKAEGTAVKKRPREDDNLFSTRLEEVEEVKKKKQKDLSEKPKTLKPKKRVVSKDKDKGIDVLNYKSLHVGMLFLGCVKEAKDFELTVNLPYGLTGFVQATNICEAYTKLLNEQVEKDVPLEALSPLPNIYSPGMLVRCAVSSLETTSGGSQSIKLSLNPKLVNADLTPSSLQIGMFLSGCVSSIEDHGYLIDLGIGGNKAFLPRQKAQVYLNQTSKAASLCVGQYLNCVIDEKKNDGRIVRLSITQSDVAAAVATVEQKWTLNNLLPGLVVKAQIDKILPDGVILSFLSSYTGVVDFLHLESKKVASYQKNQTVKACILWIDRSSKTIRLTLHKSFLQPGSAVKQLTSDWIGTLHRRCTVNALYKNSGAVFQLDGETFGFAFNKNLSISKLKTPDKFQEGTVHTGRVVGFSPIDEILLLSFKGDVIGGLYLRLEDVQVGQILEGTVNSLTPLGMVVDITQHLNGLVPTLHLADVTLHQPEKKYALGSKIKCRVLSVVPSARKLILTRKKIMINSKLPILRTYHDATPGLITHGFIWSVKHCGCVIKFYNDVQGLALVHELSSVFISSPEEVFYKGQVVKVRVLECNPEKERMLLSFNIIGEEENEGKESEPSKKDTKNFERGKIVDVKIVRKSDDGLDVLILPEERPAFLPKTHLSDHIANCELLWHCLKAGDQVTGAMCLSTIQGKTILTKKPALISFMEKEPVVKDFSEIQIGMMFTGFVTNIMLFGVFVELPYGLVGLVPKSNISDKFVTNIHDHIAVGQTVVAKVTNLDEQKKRLLLTLKMSECAPDNRSAESFPRLRQCISEVQLARSLINRDGRLGDGENLYSLVPGKKLTVVVETVQEDDSVLFSVGQIAGAHKISATQHKDKAKSLVAGQKSKVVVLHVDFLKSHVHVSVDEILLRRLKDTVIEGTSHSAVVQHVAEEFAVVSLEDTAHLAAIPLTCHLNDTFRFDSEKLNFGQKILVTIKSARADEYGLFLALRHTTKAERPLCKAMTFVERKPTIGEVVTATVKCVKPTCVMVSVTDRLAGVIHASQILEDVPEGFLPTSKLRPKQTITCRVIGGRDVKTHRYLPITHPHLMESFLELSILPRLMDTKKRIPKLRPAKKYLPGVKVTCYVTKYNNEKQYLEVDVTPEMRGRVDQLLLSKSIKVVKRPEKHFKQGQALSATVVGTGLSPKTLSLSLIDTHTLTEGCVIIGCVKTVTPTSGLEISLPFGKTGKASLFHLGDCYAESSVKDFATGMFVRCYVLSVGKTIEVSLRNSRICPESVNDVTDKEISSVGSLKEGQLVAGFVESITDKGIFFRLSSSIVGRIQFKKDPQTYASYISEGTLLTVKILTIQEKKQRLELSLLPEDTEKPDIIPKSANLIPRTKNTFKRRRSDSESEAKIPKKKKKHQETKDDEDSGIEVYCRENETEHKKSNQKSDSGTKPPAPRLQVSSGFSWDVSLNNLKTSIAGGNESSSDSDEDEEEEQSKITKKDLQKTQIRKETPDPKQQPQSVHEFERLVITSPNISANWIQYIDFNLQATELEQARAVAERALQTIYFREEQEKLTVWAAMLNMENTFGTEATLQKVFERAIQYNDPLKAFQHLVDIYIKSEKFKEAENLLNTMVKRFRQEKSVWWKYATFLLKRGQSEDTHRLLQRALKCVPEKEHVDLISKFAQLEFRFGDVVRAKALFESTLSSYPKRTDLWSVYIDMMVKHGSQKEVRDIFERVIHLSLAPKRIKFFFKRYLEYERKDGSEKTVQAVKEKALKYVESKGSAK
ncbi:protein RRP5 homolog isoform X1 [Rhinoderma darwinii]|uniref:protein RRP5 homolog isoform X1 n=1 Tax=Rhinoderma darwinii TaxID=43563 RepID=UPI003F6749CF